MPWERSGPLTWAQQEWFADLGRFESVRRERIADGEVVEFTLQWQENGVTHMCHQAHLLRIDGDRSASYRVEFETGLAETEVAAGRTIELRAARAGQRFRVQVSRDALPVATLPEYGWIQLP